MVAVGISPPIRITPRIVLTIVAPRIVAADHSSAEGSSHHSSPENSRRNIPDSTRRPPKGQANANADVEIASDEEGRLNGRADLSIGPSGALNAIPPKPVSTPSAITPLRAKVEATLNMIGLQKA